MGIFIGNIKVSNLNVARYDDKIRVSGYLFGIFTYYTVRMGGDSMNARELEIGKTYVNGNRTRQITGIVNGDVFYINESGDFKSCWQTTFRDWVTSGRNLAYPPMFEYEAIWTEDGNEYETTLHFKDLESVRKKAKIMQTNPDVEDVKIIEYKTTMRILKVR
jgi:hypothetical protein